MTLLSTFLEFSSNFLSNNIKKIKFGTVREKRDVSKIELAVRDKIACKIHLV